MQHIECMRFTQYKNTTYIPPTINAKSITGYRHALMLYNTTEERRKLHSVQVGVYTGFFSSSLSESILGEGSFLYL